MLVILFFIIVLGAVGFFLFWYIGYVIRITSNALKDDDTYHPYDEIPDYERKTYQEWFSLYYDKKELSMTKKGWIENSHEKLMTKKEFEDELYYEYMISRDD